MSRRRDSMVSIRLAATDIDCLRRAGEARSMGLSEFVRTAALAEARPSFPVPSNITISGAVYGWRAS